ncbi:MAG: J domain-containing protein [Gaiellaceae bacterium]
MTTGERRDPYSVLGIARRASEREIVRAYRRAARLSHPDGGEAGSAERFRSVNDAYAVLRDPVRRAAYDTAHPVSESPVAASRGTSDRYATRGSQHLVLGPPTPVSKAREKRRTPVEFVVYLWP